MKSIADLNQAEVERILDIVDRLNDIEVRIEVGDMKLHVRKFGDASHAFAPALAAPAPAASRPSGQAPAASPAQVAAAIPLVSAAATTPAPASRSTEGLVDVRAPMLGRFYRSSSPSEPAYVEVGTKVRAEDTVCMIEVMKLFNTVPAGVNGTVVEIVAQNGGMVEHDAVLIRVRPE